VSIAPLAAGEEVRVARRVFTALVATGLGLAVLALAVRVYMGRDAENRLSTGEAVSIAELRSPLPAAGFLACPQGYCQAAEAIPTPIFELPWERLQDYWTEVISGQKRVERIVADPESRRFVYIQHSPVLRFPDIVTVEFVQFGPDRSSIAIYSRSRYGHDDFGQNRKRVVKWLALLEKVAQPTEQPRTIVR